MTLVSVLLNLVVVVTVMTVVSLVTLVGPGRLLRERPQLGGRLRTAVPYLGVLGGVLVLNSLVRDFTQQLSWLVGFRITGNIEAIEGGFVAWLQGFAHPLLTQYFSAVYIYGYVFLIVFPLCAYLLLDEDRPLREAVVAYTLNYALGMVCYVLFIAYGPRNVMPEMVDQLLYVHWPQAQLLTSQVNTNVNVFPSLHTSLSVTVALLAVRTRRAYPRWTPVATVLSVSVAVSTMYLGIHWLTDVVAGVGLAGISVAGSVWLLERVEMNGAPASDTGTESTCDGPPNNAD